MNNRLTEYTAYSRLTTVNSWPDSFLKTLLAICRTLSLEISISQHLLYGLLIEKTKHLDTLGFCVFDNILDINHSSQTPQEKFQAPFLPISKGRVKSLDFFSRPEVTRYPSPLVAGGEVREGWVRLSYLPGVIKPHPNPTVSGEYVGYLDFQHDLLHLCAVLVSEEA